MRIYFFVTAVFCLIYYIVMGVYLGRWNSTFAVFWPVAGGIHFLLGIFFFQGQAGRILTVIILSAWVLFLLIEIQIVRAMFRHTVQSVSYLIVLGAQVRGTKITNSLLRRLEAALGYLESHPETKVIVSGGQGKGEAVSEAEAMAEYLIQNGVDRERVIKESLSTSTWENMKFSGGIIKDLSKPVAVVTNNFHVYRALLIGKSAGFQNLHGIAASSNPVFQLNYLVREFFGVLKIWLTKMRLML